MRYAFIRSEAGRYPLTLMCRVMQVCRSGYYAFCRRPPSQRATAEARLRLHVRAAFTAARGRYGSPRVHAELRAQGIRTSRKRVARLMRQQRLVVFCLSPNLTTPASCSGSQEVPMPRKSRRHFTAEQKAELLRRHHLERVPISDLCNEQQLQPSLLYRWQQRLFAEAHKVLQEPGAGDTVLRNFKQQLNKAQQALLARDALIVRLALAHFSLDSPASDG